jgi:hypothetical protein
MRVYVGPCEYSVSNVEEMRPDLLGCRWAEPSVLLTVHLKTESGLAEGWVGFMGKLPADRKKAVL